MIPIRIVFVCFALFWGTQAVAGGYFLEKTETLRNAGKLPGFTRDGIDLPRALLLDELRKSVDSARVEVKDLVLTEEKGTVELLAHDTVDTLVSLDFRFLDVDWPHRTLWLEYSESSQSASDSLIGRIFGTIAISVFEAASGSGHVEAVAAGKPWFKVDGKRVGIMLDRIPALEKPLDTRIGRYKLFDFIGIRNLKTKQGSIHVALGPV